MKKLVAIILLFVCGATVAYAQFSNLWSMSQTQESMSGFFYKGYVDAGYQAGVGHYRANRFEATTTHGFSSGNLFMGLGAGIDVLNTDYDDVNVHWDEIPVSDNAYMVPLFFDFRYYGSGAVGLFIDMKTGISFLVNDDYITINDGTIDNDISFYLSCSLGVRFALGSRTALNIGVNYGLISQRYYPYNYYDDYYYRHYDRYDGISLHALGVSVGLEW